MCKDTICLRAAETTYTDAAACYTIAHTAAATEAHGTPQQMRPTQPRGSMGLRLSLQNGGGKNHAVPAAADAVSSAHDGLSRPA